MSTRAATPHLGYRGVGSPGDSRSSSTAPGSAGTPGASRLPGRRVRWLRSAILELLLLAALFSVYRFGRTAIDGHEGTARRNAELVLDMQNALGFPSEAAIQRLFHVEVLLRLANTYYTVVHFPLMVVFLSWGFVRRPTREYRWARNLIAIQTGAALVIHIAFPLAPPRMLPNWGFTDTMAVYGPSPYEGVSADVANQFAAMPSLHIGWAVAIAYIVFRTGSQRVAAVAFIHAALTTFVVIVTANHWWLDGIVAVALLALAVPASRILSTFPAGLPRDTAAQTSLQCARSR